MDKYDYIIADEKKNKQGVYLLKVNTYFLE